MVSIREASDAQLLKDEHYRPPELMPFLVKEVRPGLKDGTNKKKLDDDLNLPGQSPKKTDSKKAVQNEVGTRDVSSSILQNIQ